MRAALVLGPILAALPLTVGCDDRPVPPSAGPVGHRSAGAPRDAPRPDVFEGTVRVADDVPAPGQRGKIFSGALLESDDGEKWVIDYNPESPFRVFRDRRVRLEGHRYRPESQALINPHVRVSTLTLVGDVPTDLAWIRVGPERCVTGSFRVHTWPPGTKLAGEPQRTFVVDHTQYSLASALGTQAPVDVAITVIAREVEPAPLYAARPGGPHLWITRIVEDCWWSYETRTIRTGRSWSSAGSRARAGT